MHDLYMYTPCMNNYSYSRPAIELYKYKVPSDTRPKLEVRDRTCFDLIAAVGVCHFQVGGYSLFGYAPDGESKKRTEMIQACIEH